MAQRRNQGPQEPDIADDPSFFWRYLKMLVEQSATALGEHSLDVRWVTVTLDTLESVLGPVLVSQGMNALGAVVQHPEALKRAIRLLGMPEQVNGLIEEGIDDIAGGLRNAYLQRNRLTATEATGALNAATGQLRTKLQKIGTYAEAKALLGDDEQEALDKIVLKLRTPPTPPATSPYDGEKAWSHYRGLLIKPSFLRALVRHKNKTAVEILAWLEGEHGSVPVAAKEVQELKATLAKAGKSLTAWLAGLLSGFVNDPGAAFLPYMRHATARRDEEQQRLDAARVQLADRRQRPPNVRTGVMLFIGVGAVIVICIAVAVIRSLLA